MFIGSYLRMGIGMNVPRGFSYVRFFFIKIWPKFVSFICEIVC